MGMTGMEISKIKKIRVRKTKKIDFKIVIFIISKDESNGKIYFYICES